MTAIGSVFLGDVQRHRLLSSSTPPSSPPPTMSPSAMSSLYELDFDLPDEVRPRVDQPTIPPELSLDLRLRWLETLLFGARQSGEKAHGHELKNGDTLARRAEELQRKMDGIVQSNDGLRKFMEHYEHHAQFLTPAFALSGTLPTAAPTYENMSANELEAFLAEMEPDIRAAERDLRDIKVLESKGVTGAGKLSDYKELQPRLEALVQAHEDDLRTAADLEKRIAALMDRYATHVDTLSELFVAWDDTIQDAEDKLARFERDRDERRRLGYE
ncbi:hypothetical protein B0H21DRAFT_119357 [Amylocystis lapponica]|nr:hypothetical protein B0H21DRAFT_119357 [Amylocystis lapponica]